MMRPRLFNEAASSWSTEAAEVSPCGLRSSSSFKMSEEMVAGGLRRNHLFDPVGEGDQAHGVLLFQHQVGQRCGQGGAVIEFAPRRRRHNPWRNWNPWQ